MQDVPRWVAKLAIASWPIEAREHVKLTITQKKDLPALQGGILWFGVSRYELTISTANCLVVIVCDFAGLSLRPEANEAEVLALSFSVR